MSTFEKHKSCYRKPVFKVIPMQNELPRLCQEVQTDDGHKGLVENLGRDFLSAIFINFGA